MDLVCFKLDADEVHTGTEEPDDSWFGRAAPWFMGADYVAPPAGQPPPPRPPPPPPGSNALYLEYGTAVELEEETYTSTTGSEYPGGGYIVKNSKDLYQRQELGASPFTATSGNAEGIALLRAPEGSPVWQPCPKRFNQQTKMANKHGLN